MTYVAIHFCNESNVPCNSWTFESAKADVCTVCIATENVEPCGVRQGRQVLGDRRRRSPGLRRTVGIYASRVTVAAWLREMGAAVKGSFRMPDHCCRT